MKRHPALWLAICLAIFYTLIGNSLSYSSLGNLGSGAQIPITIVVQAPAGGSLTNTATCSITDLSVTDPFKLNNSGSVKTVVEPVLLSVSRSGNSIVITWPADASNYYLESAASLAPPVTWTRITNPLPTVVGGVNTITLPLGTGPSYFRLHGQ